MQFQCSECHRFFTNKRSLASHKNHHNPSYHEKSRSGYTALFSDSSNEKRKNTLLDKKIKTWEKKTLGDCITCNTKLCYPQLKTCSDDCQKLYRSRMNTRTHSKETKEKISKSIQSKNPNKQKTCKWCDDCFIPKNKENFCSIECKSLKSKETSRKISESLKLAFAEGRHKGNEYRNRKKLSFLEQSFKEYIDANYPTIEYTINYTVKICNEYGKWSNNYYIDFYFPLLNIGIELDGKQHLESIEYDKKRDMEIFTQHNIPIIRISYEEYMNKSKLPQIEELLEHALSLVSELNR